MKQDALYAEAEQVFRKYIAADEQAARAGGVVPNGIEDILGGEVLKFFKESSQEFAKDGLKMTSGGYRITTIRRLPGESVNGSVVALGACVDSTGAQVVNRKGRIIPGDVLATRNFFSEERGSLKLIAQRAWKGSGC